MRSVAVTCIGAFTALACAASARAHHSGSMYAATATWIKGTVVRLEDINPHSIITLEQLGADGRVHRWAIEGPPGQALGRLNAGAELPKAGDAVEFCAFGYKTPEELSRIYPGTDFSARKPREGTEASLTGHVMVLAGELRMWEPHGLLSECMRSSDKPRESWFDLLRSSARAREAWCDQRSYAAVRSSVALRDVVAEVDASIRDACD